MKKIAIITILVCVLCIRCVRAEVLTVPTIDYLWIQDAIDVAVDGDTIVVKAGIYSGFRNVDLDFKGKAITLTSSDPEDPDVVAGTVIDCGGSSGDPHRGFLFWKGERSDSVLNGFTIRNGYHNFGGGIQCNNSSPTILNCTIELNTATDQGGGIYCLNSQASILKCRILNNRALGYDGGGIGCINSDPNIVECDIQDNFAKELGGGILLDTSNAYISRCRITGNHSGIFGGGLFSFRESAPRLENCLVAGNLAESSGGGVYLQDLADGSAVKMIHCTISENRAETLGGAIRCFDDGRVEVINCILWGNRAAFGTEIALIDTSEIILSYSNVQGGVLAIDRENESILTIGAGVIDSDPLFVGAGSWDEGILLNDISDDVWTMGDYHLQEVSPSRNAGDPEAAAGISKDLDGLARLMGNRVDMGSYELGPDLMVVSWEVSLPEGPLVPGDKGKISLVIRNMGGESVNSRMALGIYASANPSLDEEDILIAKSSNQLIRLAAGSSRTYRMRIVLPSDLQPGDYYLAAKVDADDEIIETDESVSNVIFSSGSRLVVWQFGTVGVRRNIALTVVDPDDRAVTFRLGGGGFGEIKPDFSQLDLTETTLQSSLKITTRGRGSETTLGSIQVAGGGSLKAITAKTTNITGGGIEIPAGTVRKIHLKDINESVITIGEAADRQATVSIQLGRVSDLKILSGTPIKSLTVVEWLDDEMDDVIDTARLGRLLVKGNKKATPVIEGDFEAALILRGIPNETKAVLGQAIISGRIRNAFWEITGSVGVIRAAGLDHSLLLVGVNETIDDIADFALGPGDFIQEKYEIRSVILRGAPDELFVNDSVVACWQIGSVKFSRGSGSGIGSGLIEYFSIKREIQELPMGITVQEVGD